VIGFCHSFCVSCSKPISRDLRYVQLRNGQYDAVLPVEEKERACVLEVGFCEQVLPKTCHFNRSSVSLLCQF
jgi:hypothetical protein